MIILRSERMIRRQAHCILMQYSGMQRCKVDYEALVCRFSFFFFLMGGCARLFLARHVTYERLWRVEMILQTTDIPAQ